MFPINPNDVLEFFVHILSISNDLTKYISEAALLVTLATSAVLSYIMIRYKGKRAVDIAVVMRETAIVLVISRVFMALAFETPMAMWASIIYVYLAISVITLLVLTIREQWMRPRDLFLPTNIEQERVDHQQELEQCHIELHELKEGTNASEST